MWYHSLQGACLLVINSNSATSCFYIAQFHYFSLRFRKNHNLYPKGYPLGIWAIGPNTSLFARESNSAWISHFHIDQSFLHRHSSTVCGSLSSSLLVAFTLSLLIISRATLNENMLSTIVLFLSYTSPEYCSVLRSHCIQVPGPLQGINFSGKFSSRDPFSWGNMGFTSFGVSAVFS